MKAALYSSRQQGTKEFTKDSHQFGWKTVETVLAQEMERTENGLSRKVPGLKYAYVYRDNWTRLNVRPAKIMQVFHYSPVNMSMFGHTTISLGFSTILIGTYCVMLNNHTQAKYSQNKWLIPWKFFSNIRALLL